MFLQGPDTLALTVAWLCVSFLDLAEAVRQLGSIIRRWEGLRFAFGATDLRRNITQNQ